MESKFIPKTDALKNTDWRKPEVDKKDVKKLVLLGLAVAMLAVVFIPWFCLGVKAGDFGAVKLRAFGFQTWYGILAGLLALVAVAGALYRHYSLTLCSSVIAVLVGFYALNQYPDCRLSVSTGDMVENASKALKQLDDIEEPVRWDYDEWDLYQEDLQKYEDMMRQYDRYGDLAEAAPAVAMFNELPNIKVPGQLVEAAAVMVDLVDQRFVYEALEMAGVERELDNYGVKILNHRLGAVLYLVFSVLAAALSYVLITGCCCCGKKKAACPAPEAPAAAESSETTVVNE